MPSTGADLLFGAQGFEFNPLRMLNEFLTGGRHVIPVVVRLQPGAE